MRLKREYKKGTFVKFKWYDNWRDEFDRQDNFKIGEGRIECNTCMDEVIVFNGHENKWYAVSTEDIIKEI